MTETMELADENDKTAIITICWVFKRKYEHNEETNGRYKNHIKLLEVKTTISEMKNGIWLPPEKVMGRGSKKKGIYWPAQYIYTVLFIQS